jgi:phosphohistidine phosphatase
MQLVIIRHGLAGDRETFAATGQDDALRPLTAEGRRKMKRNAKGLRRVVAAIDVLGASPLVRAAQTASIVASAYGGLEVTTVPALAPGASPKSFLAWLRKQQEATVVAVVGHEPDLGALASWLLTGEEQSHLPLRKGGACLVELEGRPRPGAATLQWALTPRMLRRLRD